MIKDPKKLSSLKKIKIKINGENAGILSAGVDKFISRHLIFWECNFTSTPDRVRIKMGTQN